MISLQLKGLSRVFSIITVQKYQFFGTQPSLWSRSHIFMLLLGKEYIKAVYCHPAYLTYSEYIMRNTGLEEAQIGINIAGRNINHLRFADDTTLMAESEEELKSLLMKVKEESEKVDLKLNIQKMKIMASGPITSWEIDGETVETVSDFIFGAPKSLPMVTAAMKLKDTYSLEGKLRPT